jgi:hypothetical protein
VVGVSTEAVQKSKHIKTGNIYTVLGEATDATNSRSGHVVVIYARDGRIFVREVTEFAEKFEAVY